MRVIAGSARGRSLQAPAHEGTRPTSDKVKGAIFSMLEAEAMRRGYDPEPDDEERGGRFAAAVAWPRVLELYAGSGALAVEALSRGAAHADLVESSADARRAIAANLARTGLAERANVHGFASERAVSTLRGPYDLLLCDPPYDATGTLGVLEQVAGSRLLGPASVVVWEHSRTVEPPARIGGANGTALQLLKTRRHGSAAISLYAVGKPEDAAPDPS